jgi:hypothetical protein
MPEIPSKTYNKDGTALLTEAPIPASFHRGRTGCNIRLIQKLLEGGPEACLWGLSATKKESVLITARRRGIKLVSRRLQDDTYGIWKPGKIVKGVDKSKVND